MDVINDPGRILVVDDSFAMRSMITQYLKEFGLQYLEASCGKVALSLLHENEVNIIIADVNLPFMDGITLANSIRTRPESHNIKIIFATSEYDKSIWNKVNLVGADGWIIKPVSRELLLEVITR